MKKIRTFFALLALSIGLAVTNPVFSQDSEAATENAVTNDDDDDDDEGDEGKWGLAGLLGLLGLLGLRKRDDDRHHGTHVNR